MIKVLLVDDHELVRMGVKRLLADVKGIQVVGEAESGEEAIKIARLLHPDVVLMDVNMPGMGGLEATRRLLHYLPDTKVITLTVHGEEPFPTRCMQAGATGYLTKGASVDEMVQAIRQVHVGQRYIAQDIAQQLAVKIGEENPIKGLSEREMQVFLMIAEGVKSQDISDRLCVSPKTISTYRYRIYDKLNITTDVDITHMAIRHGLINPGKL